MDQDLARLDNNGVSLSTVFIVILSSHQQNIYNNTHKCLVSSVLSSEDSKNNSKFEVNLRVNRFTCKCRFIVNMTEYGYSEIFENWVWVLKISSCSLGLWSDHFRQRIELIFILKNQSMHLCLQKVHKLNPTKISRCTEIFQNIPSLNKYPQTAASANWWNP